MNPRMLVLLAALITLAAAFIATGPILAGAQPWGPTLSDNLLFAKLIPFALGFGVAVGAARGLRPPRAVERRASDDAIRRFDAYTVLMHWIAALGFMLALVSGAWQYLKGLLDVESPVFMPYVYRLHYVGALLLLFATGAVLTTWWVSGARALAVPGGQWIRHLRGLAHELPRPLGGVLAGFLGLDMRREPPPVEQFTYYEKVVSFPTWLLLVALIVVTGLLKAMRYLYPIPGDVLWWASALHVAGLILLAAKLLDHLRYVLSPVRWPLFRSMVSGWIGERYARHCHPAWYEAMQQERDRAGPAPETPRPPAAPSAPAPRPAAGPSAGGGSL